MIQIRNVPEEVHRRLKARAASMGLSLSDYLLQQIRTLATQPTMDELFARLRTRKPVTLSVSPADVIRELRGR